MINPGRNDPCHCGSGKKYKKCHLDADQRSHSGIRQSQPRLELPAGYVAVENMAKLLRRLSEQGSARERKEFAELLSKTEPLLEYLERREEIEAASAKLEAHRSEFEELAADWDRFMDLTEAVFAEECFAPLRFTASEVQSAFDHVGYPATLSPDDRTVEILRAAILRVANQE